MHFYRGIHRCDRAVTHPASDDRGEFQSLGFCWRGPENIQLDIWMVKMHVSLRPGNWFKYSFQLSRLQLTPGGAVWPHCENYNSLFRGTWQKCVTLTIIFSKRSIISFSERFMERSSKRGWGTGSSVWVDRGSVGCWMRGFSFFIPVFLKLVMRSRWKKTMIRIRYDPVTKNPILGYL